MTNNFDSLVFQFLIGAIKRRVKGYKIKDVYMFQFLIGAIKSKQG